MQDDIDFLSGENRELQLKVKDVCLQNAQLKLRVHQVEQNQLSNPQIISCSDLAAANQQNSGLDNFDNDEGAIEEAGLEEAKNEGNSRFNGASFLSGDDSFIQQMNKNS